MNAIEKNTATFSYAALLHERAATLAEAALAAVFRDDCQASAKNFVQQLAACLDGGPQPNVTLLHENMDDDALARVLRALVSETIALFNASLERDEAAEGVVKLRQVVSPLIPPRRMCDVDDAFYATLMAETPEAFDEQGKFSAAFLQRMLGVARDMLYVHDLDGHFLYINSAGLTLLGFTKEDLAQGLSVYDMVTPEYTDLVDAQLEMPGASSCAPYCIEIFTKNGERIPVEITSRTIVKDNRVRGVMGAVRDLTLTRKLEDRIHHSYSCFEFLASHAPMGVMYINGTGHIEQVNDVAAHLLGEHNPDHLRGERIHQLKSPGMEPLFTALSKATTDGCITECEVTSRTAEGIHTHFKAHIKPIIEMHSHVTGHLLLLNESEKTH